MSHEYQITFKDGTTDKVKCDAIQQNGGVVIFIDVKKVSTPGAQQQGDIVMWVNAGEVKKIALIPVRDRTQTPALAN